MSFKVDHNSISIVGKHHKSKGELCQDRSASGKVYVGDDKKESVYFIAVADGIGSEVNSGFGAELACNIIKDNVKMLYKRVLNEKNSALAQEAFKAFLEFVRMKAIKHAERLGTERNTMGTTLSFAIMGKDSTFIVSMGDSPVAIKFTNGEFITKTGNYDEYACSTVSAFSSVAWSCIYAAKWPTSDIEGIFITSDGGDMLTHPKDGVDPLEWTRSVKLKSDLEEIAKQIVDLQHDDVSIAYLIPRI